MYCKKCGKEMPNGVQFCPACGTKTDSAPTAAKATVSPKPNPAAGVLGGKNASTLIFAVVAILAVVLLVFGLRSCSAGDSKVEPAELLVGTWVSSEDSSIGFKFKTDGTVAISGLGMDVGSDKVSYEADKDTITLRLSAFGLSSDIELDYELSKDKNTLTVTLYGESIELKRK